MQEIVKKLLNNGLDSDSADFLVPPTSFISGQNLRIGGSTDKGGVGNIENILRNAEKFHVLPSGGTNTTIGFAGYDENGWVVKFNHNSAGNHGIYLFNVISELWYTVLLSSDVTGGLNFARNELIHSVRIENDNLYWCNGRQNEPRRINLKAAINTYHASPGVFAGVSGYTLPISQNVLYWIRRQPGLPPSQTKMTSSPVLNNFIKDEGFWFSYRYIYRDFEVGTLSALSTLANYNTAAQTTAGINKIYVTIPVGEPIEQDVLQVDLVVKYAGSGKSFVIKSWNKNVAADLVSITAHNNLSPSVPLYFDFYNDFIGIALDDAYSVKPYDSLPIYAQTIEIARNRAFMGNYTLGYDTPTTTSLSAEVGVQTVGGGIASDYWELVYDPGFGIVTNYLVRLTNVGAQNGWYWGAFSGNPPPLPSSIDFTTLAFYGSTFISVLNNVGSSESEVISFTGYGLPNPTITSGPAPSDTVGSLAGSVSFKSGATYHLSVSFFDHAGRKCGILTSPLKIEVAERAYAQITFTTALSWVLSNALAVNEIPSWAVTYSVNLTKCLTTRQFIQSRGKNIVYVTKTTAGVYVFDTTISGTYLATQNGIGIDRSLLNSYGMGYVFAEGDLVKVYIGSSVYILSVIATEGNWIVCGLQDLSASGALGTTGAAKSTFLFEVFTPYKPSVSEPHYEVEQIFKITNPGLVNRTYSTLTGVINGDITLLLRNDGTDYITENMSPNDKFWTKWNTDSGRPNFIDTIGQETRTNDIAYSNTLIQGTKTNGLSTFEALNVKDIPIECGDISKLQTADKISEQGNIMLAICFNETASLYLGEVQILGTSGNAFLAQSADVIGSVNIMQGSMGTMNPESVVALNGRVFWFDIISSYFVAYATNGLFPISNYGMKRVTNLFSKKYASLSQTDIEILGSRPFIFGGVDPYHEEVYFSIPTTESTPPKGFLGDIGTSNATASITITNIGDNGDIIDISVNDPYYGNISLGSYIKLSSDTTATILATSIKTVINTNIYEYIATSLLGVITITARGGLGATMNIGNRLSVVITAFSNNLLINPTDFMLINSTDKFII